MNSTVTQVNASSSFHSNLVGFIGKRGRFTVNLSVFLVLLVFAIVFVSWIVTCMESIWKHHELGATLRRLAKGRKGKWARGCSLCHLSRKQARSTTDTYIEFAIEYHVRGARARLSSRSLSFVSCVNLLPKGSFFDYSSSQAFSKGILISYARLVSALFLTRAEELFRDQQEYVSKKPKPKSTHAP
jgi:hypothetical protein